MAIDLSPAPAGASAAEQELAFWRNAHYLAVASDLAYLAETGDDFGVKMQFESKLQARNATIFPQNAPGVNVQYVLAETDDAIILAFRGSESIFAPDAEGLKDWLVTDASARLRSPQPGEAEWLALGPGAQFHTGFSDAIRKLQVEMLKEVEARAKAKPRPLWITGHSLGGALAHLAAWLLDYQAEGVEVVRVVTFAAPMVMNLSAAEQFDRFLRTRLFRFANVSDPVPRVPILDLLHNPYRHVGQRIDLAAEDQSPVTADDLLGVLRAFADRLFGQLNKVVLRGLLTNVLVERVNAHQLNKGYVSRIEAWRRSHGDSVP